MPNSMTGFGTAEGAVAGGRMAVDLRSVNHRHFNLQIRVPHAVNHLEQTLRERLRARVARGHVNLGARWVEEPPRGRSIRVNIDQARGVVAALDELRRELDLPGEVDLGFIARQPDVLEYTGDDDDVDLSDEFLALVDAAADQLVTMRAEEGRALQTDLDGIVRRIETLLQQVETMAPARLEKERARLSEAVGQLLGDGSINRDRLELEIALIADKLDISEEIVRLTTHLHASLQALGTDEPVGRKLAFLGQEMLREINTIGSKANDSGITESVIAMKGELEKFREQVENLE